MNLLEWVTEALRESSSKTLVIPAEAAATPHRRLVLALRDPLAGVADLVVALRGVVRWEELARRSPAEVEVPRALFERIAPKLQASGLVAREDGDSVMIGARPWRPAWLADQGASGVDTAFRPARRRPVEGCPGDPVLSALDLENYISSAQREAVRSVLCSEPGDTVAVCLPTGAGKSLCAFLPAMQTMSPEGEERGVSLIVVPTVALAIDLAAKVESFVGHRVAYRPEEEEESRAIRERCGTGMQGPVIVSPEAVVGGLYPALQAAARNKWLRYFVVDEAHMVLSWGDEFRPAFLQLAAARRALGRLAGPNNFVTLLLSATLTDYHLRWLRTLFTDGERFTLVHAARLRPEPAYWRAHAGSESVREDWIKEALLHLPRPCIVYVTKRSDCARWHRICATAGFGRIAMMTGDTSPDQRRALLERWHADEIDVMVATSAFGLGIDKPDVRTVIHAQLPETVDRFYQDVGRGGRDGSASISLLVTTRYDWAIVGRIGKPMFITPARGLQRWRRMLASAEVVSAEDNVRNVDLNTGAELDMTASEYNRAWNLRTLQIMQRAEALEFVHAPGRSSPTRVAVRTASVRHLDASFWESAVGLLRNELQAEYYHNAALLRAIVREDSDCLATVFDKCYRSDAFGVGVVRACGGCPACRRAKRAATCGRIRTSRTPRTPKQARRCDDNIQRLFAGSNSVFIFYPNQLRGDQLQRELSQPLAWLAWHGAMNFVMPQDYLPLLRQIGKETLHGTVLWHARPPRELCVTSYQLTTALVARPEASWWSQLWASLSQRQRRLVVFAPDDLRCPDSHNRSVRDIIDCPGFDLSQWNDRFVA